MTKVTVKELRAKAKELGIRGYSRMKKAELCDAVTRAEVVAVELTAKRTVKELRVKAKALGLKGYSRMKKVELEVALERAEAQRNHETAQTEPEETEAVNHDEAEIQRAYEGAVKDWTPYVKVSELRRKVNWPREKFDEELRRLRDLGKVQMYLADASAMTREEVIGSFVDELGYRYGTLTMGSEEAVA